MKQNIFIMICLWLASCLSGNCTEQTSASVPKGTATMDTFIHAFIKDVEKQLPHLQGGAIAIVFKGQVIYQKTFGHQKNKTNPITDKVLFSLASVSKPVSATILACLVKQGKISLEDSLSTYLPTIDQRVKIRDILCHASGYLARDSNRLIEQGKKREEIFSHYLTQSPEHPSSKVYAYHNLLFSGAEEVASQASGTSWPHMVRDFWQILGASEGDACTLAESVAVASPHKVIKNKRGKEAYTCLRRVPRHYPSSVCSSAGIYASLKGMIQFLKLHLGYLPHILDQKDLAPFHQAYVETPEIFSIWSVSWPFAVEKMQAFYGLGWRILTLKNEAENHKKLIFHGGYLEGVNTFVGLIPAYDVGIVILTNQDSSWALRTGIRFWGELVKKFK